MKTITISQYAEMKGITRQAVYKQLNNKLSSCVVIVEGKKYIDLDALGVADSKQVEQPTVNESKQVDNYIVTLLEKQIEEKDKTISVLLRQIDNLQEVNAKLTTLMQNSQFLLATEQHKEKRKIGLLGWFKKKESE